MIACVYVEHFVATIERSAHGLAPTRPLVVCAVAPPGLVVAACRLAAARGVHAGMTDALARARCPDAAIVTGSPQRSASAARDVTALLSTWSTRVVCDVDAERPGRCKRMINERHGACWWFLDLGRSSAAGALDIAIAITEALSQHSHLTAVVAVAPTRFTAWCAALTQGACYVPAERAAGMLAPLPIDLLPLDEPTAVHLDRLGLRTLGQLAALPPGALETQCGGAGRLLRHLARGEDRDPIPPYVPEQTLRAVRHADGAVSDTRMLDQALATMAQRLADRLARRGQAARVVELHLTLEDGPPWVDARILDAPSAQQDVLKATLQALRWRAKPASGVERIDVVLRELCARAVTQLSLLDEPPSQSHARQQTLITVLGARFGHERLLRIRALVPAMRVPEQRYRLDNASGM